MPPGSLRRVLDRAGPVVAFLKRRQTGEMLMYAAAILAVAVAAAQMNAGQLFNEDYAVYLQQSFNIAHHIPMRNMGVVHVFNPALPLSDQSPLMYPPLLPLIYALPVYFLGFDIGFIKHLQILLLLGGLVLFCRAMRKAGYTPFEIAASVLVFGVSVEVRRSIGSIGSDLPFILFLSLVLLAAERYIAAAGRRAWGAAAVAGAAIFLAVDMRTVGVALMPALFLADAAAHRRLRPQLAAVAGVAAAFWLAQRLLVGQGESYGYIFHYAFFTPVTNLMQFYWSLTGPLERSALGSAAAPLFLGLVALAGVGTLEGVWRGRMAALFAVCYAAILLILPDFNAGARYLVPLLLLLGAFACRGASVLALWLKQGAAVRRAAPAAAGVLALALFAAAPSPFSSQHPLGVTTSAAEAAFAFIRSNVPAHALVAATKYRSFHLFTGRRTIRLAGHGRLGGWLRRNRVDYVVLKYAPRAGRYDFSDCPRSALCAPGARPYAEAVFRNADFVVYRIKSS